MDEFGKDARLETRMLADRTPATEKQRELLIEDLVAYRERTRDGKRPIAWAKLAKRIGISETTLSEMVAGKYKGDVDAQLRRIDTFLAREASESKRPDIRGFQRLNITQHIVAVYNQCVVHRSIGVITAEPGTGKTLHAQWLRDNNDGVILITCDDKDVDANFVVDEVHKALRLSTYAPTVRLKKREVVEYLQNHQNVVILVDEAQKLTIDAMEILRAFHDKSDPEGKRCVPILLFGDDKFYQVVLKSRGQARTPLSPQITRRMFPVVALETIACDRDKDGRPVHGTTYTLDDITKIVRAQRLKVFRPEAMRYAVKLANYDGHGRLGLATKAMEVAMQLCREGPVTMAHMQAAMTFFFGPEEADALARSVAAERDMPAEATG